jgi:hypothetical protein
MVLRFGSALKALLLAADPDTFTHKLDLDVQGYATVSALNILTRSGHVVRHSRQHRIG